MLVHSTGTRAKGLLDSVRTIKAWCAVGIEPVFWENETEDHSGPSAGGMWFIHNCR